MKLLSLLLLTWALAICQADEPDCKNHKQAGHDSFACVCTTGAPCPAIETPAKTATGVVTLYQSGRDGARLRKSTLHFGKQPEGDGKVGAEQLHVKVNQDVKHQEVFGFGGAFTDSTGINIRKAGDKLGDQILRDYFSKDGIEYSVGRIPIGGSDFSTRPYELDDGGEDKTLAKFNLTSEDLDDKSWNSMRYSAETTRDFVAKTLGPELEASGWGPDKLKLMVLDHNLDLVKEWVRVIFADKTAAK
ncbi:unnamed protein product, partial [Oppiella nova]